MSEVKRIHPLVPFLVLLAAGSAASAQVPGSIRLFEEVPEPGLRLTQEQQRLLDGYRARPTTGDSRLVRVDFRLLAQEPTLDLGVFGETIPVARKRIERRAEDDYSWFGEDTYEGNRAVLVSKGGRLTGTFYDGDPANRRERKEGYAVRFIGDGLHVVLKVDPSVPIPPEAEPALVAPGNPGGGGGGVPCHTFTLLIAYTPKAAEQEGDIFGLAQTVIDELNDLLENSDVPLHGNLVYIYETDYDEYEKIGNGKNASDQNIYLVEDRFSQQGDGYMDEVHNYRDLAGADIAVMIGDGKSPAFNKAGRASAIAADADSAFAVVAHDYATGPWHYAFPHEVGHLLGGRHNIEEDDAIDPFEYGHGFVYNAQSPGWRTVMALWDPVVCGPWGTCPVEPHYSNPDVDIDGIPTGNDAEADNARVFTERSCVVAGFRKGIWK